MFCLYDDRMIFCWLVIIKKKWKLTSWITEFIMFCVCVSCSYFWYTVIHVVTICGDMKDITWRKESCTRSVQILKISSFSQDGHMTSKKQFFNTNVGQFPYLSLKFDNSLQLGQHHTQKLDLIVIRNMNRINIRSIFILLSILSSFLIGSLLLEAISCRITTKITRRHN